MSNTGNDPILDMVQDAMRKDGGLLDTWEALRAREARGYREGTLRTRLLSTDHNPTWLLHAQPVLTGDDALFVASFCLLDGDGVWGDREYYVFRLDAESGGAECQELTRSDSEERALSHMYASAQVFFDTKACERKRG